MTEHKNCNSWCEKCIKAANQWATESEPHPDTIRMDWLQKTGSDLVQHVTGAYLLVMDNQALEGKTPREAIDAAMKAEKE